MMEAAPLFFQYYRNMLEKTSVESAVRVRESLSEVLIGLQ